MISIPTRKYAFAAATLLKTIATDVDTIKRWAILDSGDMGHFLTTDAPASNVQPTTTPIIARLPNGDRVHSTHTCMLDIPTLPRDARAAHIIPGLASHSLLSVFTMCNAGCEVNFTKIGCTVKYCSRTITCGQKCTKTGLRMLPLATNLLGTSNCTAGTITSSNHTTAPLAPTTPMAANIDATSSAAEYAQYIHQILCSPPATTLLHALSKGTKLTTILGLTQVLVRTHLPRLTATDKGHMRRHCANMASTRNNQADILTACAKVDCMSPQQEACAMHDMFCFAALANANTGTMYTDLTGAFPICSFKNMQYIFVAYIYDLNAIIVRAMPSRTDAAFVTAFVMAFSEIFDALCNRNYQPTLNVMDNECSRVVEQHICANKMSIQLVPPHNHRVNAAEGAIATFKEHFIAALATVDSLCPLPQVELTLNLLRFSRQNPSISANQEVYGCL
ncbi:hypothetical protein ACHAW5_004642 [Stephanodiscus triporus]|uniref:Integrase catalytic domain-containing protein n=1 Tax=Stephanodiscus triporus TaxID=2934178 RepID=A0ABD3MP10_9STRA